MLMKSNIYFMYSGSATAVQYVFKGVFCMGFLGEKKQDEKKDKKEKKRPEKPAPRFRTVYTQTYDTFGECKILVDTVTGVNYLLVDGPSMGGLTPLLDQNGKPVVSVITDDRKEN